MGAALLLFDCASERTEHHRALRHPGTTGGSDAGAAAGEGGARAGEGGEPGATGGATAGGGASGRGGSHHGGATSGGEGGDGRGGSDTGGMVGTGGTAGMSGGDAGDGPAPPGVRVTKISIYQSVEIGIMQDGVAISSGTTRVAERPLLLRAWVEPDAELVGAEVVAELEVADAPGAPVSSIRQTVRLAGVSTDAELASTVNVTLPAEHVTPSTELAFRLRRTADDEPILAQWPSNGRFPLEAESDHGSFQVVLVPLVANGHSPDVSPEIVERYRSYLERIYPVSGVSMSLRSAYELPVAVQASGAGWEEALDELYALRALDAPSDNVFYYGVLAPEASFAEYCPADCFLGVSIVGSLSDIEYRGAIGTGFFDGPDDTRSPETLAHELGHALGRGHSTCGVADADPFPYPGGGIGVRGFDGQELLEPDVYKDVMGYCLPVWVSDVNYSRFFARISSVNAQANQLSLDAAPAVTLRTLVMGADGELRWGLERRGVLSNDGETTSVELLDARGSAIGTLVAPFRRFDHLPGGLVTVPTRALDGVSAVRVGSSVLAVP